MTSQSLQDRRDETTETVDAADPRTEQQPPSISVTVIVQHRYTFGAELVTGRQIRKTADVPADFTLYRRVKGGNQPIPDDLQVELHNGDHFFARPSSSAQ
ncbi:MAG TPA: hypothetical protein VJ966_14305 [Actinomycetes bacterium]|nr:hypothetical protein [Actinomycetes bacterium]